MITFTPLRETLRFIGIATYLADIYVTTLMVLNDNLSKISNSQQKELAEDSFWGNDDHGYTLELILYAVMYSYNMRLKWDYMGIKYNSDQLEESTLTVIE